MPVSLACLAGNGLPDGLASHSPILPTVPDANAVGTFHAPPYEVFLPDLQGGPLMSTLPCMTCALESAEFSLVEIGLFTFADAKCDMQRRVPAF